MKHDELVDPKEKRGYQYFTSYLERARLWKATKKILKTVVGEDIQDIIAIETSGYKAGVFMQKAHDLLYPERDPLRLHSLHPSIGNFAPEQVRATMKNSDPSLFAALFKKDGKLLLLDDFAEVGVTLNICRRALHRMGVTPDRIKPAVVVGGGFGTHLNQFFCSVADAREHNLEGAQIGLYREELKTLRNPKIRGPRIIRSVKTVDDLFERPENDMKEEEAAFYREMDKVIDRMSVFTLQGIKKRIGFGRGRKLNT